MALVERKDCPVCNSSNLQCVLSLPYTDNRIFPILLDRYKGKVTESDICDFNYEIWECNYCSFLFQKYVPDDFLSEKIYSYDLTRVEKSLSKKREAPIDYYARYALICHKISLLLGKKPHEIKLLDFGSGWGYFLEMAKAHGFNTLGIEISQERKDYCEERGLTIKRTLDEVVEVFDFIYSDQTFEHLSYPAELMTQLLNILDKRGMIYVHVPNCINTKKKLLNFTKIVDDLFPLEHINGFTNKSLKIFANQYDLKVVSPLNIFSSEHKAVSLTLNGHLLQDAIKSFHTINHRTELYFKK